MAPAIQAPAEAAGPTPHTQNQPATTLRPAAQRLLLLLNEHDRGAGVRFEPHGGLIRIPSTGDTFARVTAAQLGAQGLIRFGGTAHDPVRITTAGRDRAGALGPRRRGCSEESA